MALKERKIDQADANTLVDTLLACIHKADVRGQNVPTKGAFGVLMHFVIQYYGNHTCQEITLAFDMANAYLLDVDPKCYENFSCRYFGSIMTAYRRWAREEYKQIKTEVPMLENKESLSDQAMADWLKDLTGRVKAGGYLVDFMPLSVYEWMDGRGEITATPAEKNGYLVKAADYLLSQMTDWNDRRLKEFAAMRKAGAFTGEYIQALKNLAKRMILFDMVLRARQMESKFCEA